MVLITPFLYIFIKNWILPLLILILEGVVGAKSSLNLNENNLDEVPERRLRSRNKIAATDKKSK